MTDVHEQSPRPEEPAQQEQEAFNYQILVGHPRTDGHFKTDEELRSQYIQLTDALVDKMTNGVEVKNHITGEMEKKVPDVVVWLDKSARPVAWLTKELWPTLAADVDGNVPKMPETKFVNIDREQWVNHVDPQGTGYMDSDKIDPTVIRSLRSIFVEPKYKEKGLTPEIDEVESSLDGKTVLIVDEVMSTGRTLDIAQKFFKRAFPTADIAVAHWMAGLATKGMARGNADLPVWYKDKNPTGRGIDNRNDKKSARSVATTQRLGAMFLSTRFDQPDALSMQLRKELHKLAEDVADKKVLVVPASERDEADFDERLERLNGMSLAEFVIKKQAQDQQIASHDRNKGKLSRF